MEVSAGAALKISSRGNLASRGEARSRNLFDALPFAILGNIYIPGRSRIIINYPCTKSTLARVARVSVINLGRANRAILQPRFYVHYSSRVNLAWRLSPESSVVRRECL